MSFCTYTAQGFLLCKDQNKNSEPKNIHYSTIGFDRDVEAGVFIEPFSQDVPAYTEQFGLPTPAPQLPSWIQNKSFDKCTNCKYSSCTPNKKCNLECTCSSCDSSGASINKLVKQNISTTLNTGLYYCNDGDSEKPYRTNSSCTVPTENYILQDFKIDSNGKPTYKCQAPAATSAETKSQFFQDYHFKEKFRAYDKK
jgi:hypothetical protein